MRVIDSNAQPITGASVVTIADNGTTLRATTDDNGIAYLSFRTRRMYRLLGAHSDYPAAIVEPVDPGDDLEVTITASDSIGSVIMHDTGYIPGLAGGVQPILDTDGRHYVYAENIAINGDVPQPAEYRINEPP